MEADSVSSLRLNDRALKLVEETLLRDPSRFRVHVSAVPGGGRLVDAGVSAPGGLEAGLLLARVCLADLGRVSLEAAGESGAESLLASCPIVHVATDHPVAACMASQYAGWQLSVEKFFGMGSGPFRAAYGKEALFDAIGHRENAEAVAGVLETSALPGPEVFRHVAERARVPQGRVTLLAARTKSLAGSVQIVARSVETALHKLHHLRFDLARIVSARGSAPLPPPARSDLAALGRTNDAVLYGGRVTLWVRGDDESLASIGPQVPSESSRDFGAPFAEVFERYGRDFYKVDPGLFSPAEITFQNLDTGRTQRFGRLDSSVLERSFFA